LQEIERVLGDPGSDGASAVAPTGRVVERTRVLVVDDDEVIRRVVLATLNAGGYDAVGVDDGDAALRRLAEGAWDLIVTDLHMSRVGGEELLRSVRANVKT